MLVATKSKVNIEKGIQLLLAILEKESDYVPAILLLAISYILIKQDSKARNQLKRIAKMPYNPLAAEEFEQSYLLLTEIYTER